MYQVITRIADGAVVDCRAIDRVDLSYVLKTQVIPNWGGNSEDYQITTAAEEALVQKSPEELTAIRAQDDAGREAALRQDALDALIDAALEA